MANSDDVVAAFTALRNSLTTLAAATSLDPEELILLQRAMIAGSLAEDCRARFGSGSVPRGETAIAQADSARQAADAVQGDAQNKVAVNGAIDATNKACDTLSGIINTTSAARPSLQRMMASFPGSLRVSAPSPKGEGLTDFAAPGTSQHATASAPPAYAVSVAKLFPVEAATLFPIGQALAAGNGAVMAVFIVLVLLFVTALRYFGTLQDGKPAVGEIFVSAISFLLWVGSLKGYWVERGLVHVTWITPEMSAGFFGIATTMWVALVPFMVQLPAAREGQG